MDKRDLQRLLNQPYKQENWKQIVQFVFPNVSILSTPKEFPINNEKIKKFRQIGSIRLNDGKNLALFELLLADTVNIQRNRVELNNEISKYIDQEQIHGVLSVFEQGTDDYRFTFSARSTEFDEEESDFIQKKTDTKRYTYVLGKNESCKTPADRFYKLSENKADVDINAIQHAFSVEQLSKEFFDKYKKQFDKFWKYIASKDEYKNVFHANDQEKQEVKIRNFTKKLLGRIVFLHFLQKKGWMGCPEQELWGSGDKKFMQNLFKDFTHKEQFHSKCLVELFYNTLNAKRDEQLFSCEGLEGALNKSKVPYLNGGLFDSDKLESTKIDFPESYFEDLFDFFGQYNFTIDENDPNDHEVGIDPEMLGHIFENLLEDNKDKGAFYTPKVIVQYMCQESIIEYLATKLSAETSGKVKQAIEDLIRNRLAEEISDLDLVEPVAQALYDVKICDPAIGSGAFPMGILNVIYQVIEALFYLQPVSVAIVWDISDTEWQPHLVKKNIIQHSIYGVDIESGAVDVARLRFWLALVVDEVEPLPLPNLDYKIMQGNSLLESFEGIDLSQISDAAAYEAIYESEQIDMFSGEAKKKVTMSLNFEDVKNLMDDYFNANDPETKKDLHKRIDDQVLNHIHFTLSEHKNEIKKKANKLEKKLSLVEAAARTWEQKEKIRTSSKAAKELIKLNTELSEYDEKEHKLAQLSQSNERPFFLWHLFFQEVFDQGGFDIVIGNPPYVKEYTNKNAFDGLRNSQYYQGKMDLWYFFGCFCLDLLKEKGVECFIAQNNWITSSGASKFRTKVLEDTEIKIFTDFWNYKVFNSAGIQTMVYLLQKRMPKINYYLKYSVLKNDSLKKSHLVSFLDFKIKQKSSEKFILNFNTDSYRNSLITFNSPIIDNVLNKIANNAVSYLKNDEVAQGIVYPQDKLNKKNLKKLGSDFKLNNGIFQLSEKELKKLCLENNEKELIKPFFSTKQLSKFYANPNNNEWVIYTKSNIKTQIHLYPIIKKHLDKYSTIITSDNKPYGLHRPRNEDFFLGKKILSLRKTEFPCFTYTDFDCFVSQTFFSIKTNRFDLKYLTAILNSKLISFWLRYKGKMQGNNYQVDKAPLLSIPLLPSVNESLFIDLVDKILVLKGEDTSVFENQIDNIVYKLYNLTYEDVLVIEPEFSDHMNNYEYEKFRIE
ncbi:BREX-1 system adenine-specific DNA-methyltransferase PglX [Flavobacteriaceae bacterium]|nr:BREX-1 system adenine-specific DNA-methyltransferase PglX [Flavobacteriaceae bacterium]